ncbi:MAG: hypothetical protein AAGE01_08725 [Pseudomonadota bacterium]
MVAAVTMPQPEVRLPSGCTLAPGVGGAFERRESRLQGTAAVDVVLECWQLAMAHEHDWLPLAAERSNIAAWLTMDAQGISWRYAVALTAIEEELEIIETLTTIGTPAC